MRSAVSGRYSKSEEEETGSRPEADSRTYTSYRRVSPPYDVSPCTPSERAVGHLLCRPISRLKELARHIHSVQAPALGG